MPIYTTLVLITVWPFVTRGIFLSIIASILAYEELGTQIDTTLYNVCNGNIQITTATPECPDNKNNADLSKTLAAC